VSKETIGKFYIGERLDKVATLLHPEYSRSALTKLIENGSVLVNGVPEKAKYKVRQGDNIIINLEQLQRKAADIELPIIYEDDDVIVFNKQTGILTHSKGDFNKEGTVATFLKDHVAGVIPTDAEGSTSKDKSDLSTSARDDEEQDFWQSNRAGIVHRLDRGTSGLSICAKNKETQDYLQGQFSKRNVKKTYVAIISGELPEKTGHIDVPIERNPTKPATFRAGINGKSAQTDFLVLDVYEGKNGTLYSKVQLSPRTGRTHQLRVHLAYLKRPIVGDEFYSGESAGRLMLHAHKLELTLPSRERRIFEAPVPTEMNHFQK
jgi:23S rRNA pseudouridine1911/1915/1917 synthase